jgi:hypothetical protein
MRSQEIFVLFCGIKKSKIFGFSLVNDDLKSFWYVNKKRGSWYRSGKNKKARNQGKLSLLDIGYE